MAAVPGWVVAAMVVADVVVFLWLWLRPRGG
jgi:hypothetical protein